jgi:hypothetical protein
VTLYFMNEIALGIHRELFWISKLYIPSISISSLHNFYTVSGVHSIGTEERGSSSGGCGQKAGA